MTINRRQLIATMASTALLAGNRASFAQGSGIFRIGAPNCITGAGAAYGTGTQKMLQAGVEAVNAAGGAAGLKFEISTEDTQTQPQAAVLAVKKLIEVNEVQALLGIWSSGESLATLPLASDADLLFMNTSGAPALSVPPANAKGLSYRFQATNDRFGRALIPQGVGKERWKGRRGGRLRTDPIQLPFRIAEGPRRQARCDRHRFLYRRHDDHSS